MPRRTGIYVIPRAATMRSDLQDVLFDDLLTPKPRGPTETVSSSFALRFPVPSPIAHLGPLLGFRGTRPDSL